VETLDWQTRQYSLCNSLADRHRYVITVLREGEGRGGSKWMHDLVQAGDTIRVGAPRNRFSLVDEVEHVSLIAGGIGTTPILCMAEHLARAGRKFGSHFSLRMASTFRCLVNSAFVAPA
jgi:vanillate monooxygenase ferredoxin subunit